jgi:hypothetical protein
MMNKKRMFLLTLGGSVCVLLIAIVLVVCLLAENNVPQSEDYPYRYDFSMDTYIQQTYVDELGGSDAYDFLPKYEDLNNYSTISFAMCHNESVLAPNWLYQFKTAYMVSLKYTADQDQEYQLQKAATLENSEYKSFKTGFREDARVNILISQYTDFPRCVAMLFYNDETKELIYLFLYDTKYKDVYYANRRILKDYPFSRDFFMDEETSVS